MLVLFGSIETKKVNKISVIIDVDDAEAHNFDVEKEFGENSLYEYVEFVTCIT